MTLWPAQMSVHPIFAARMQAIFSLIVHLDAKKKKINGLTHERRGCESPPNYYHLKADEFTED